ncbi:uncharacterized protein LOC111061634 isoform X2 [Nilaparvata lugens]|uniref:uncharacterized protein LOC111061634 isoform X2 n=1 Tax=Nilaparvata lugens TaxID=108931 RepID=UPI00193CFD8A|nr:uncharacterized protein LOC111061634 isoform X2 [Nilaparvata lugens]XP_039286968.1 uncharacterized protein LOC111061634 isoform X2 [Nilaparvata lugens]
MATVAVKEETNSCQDPVPGCSTAWSPNDNHVDEDDCDGRKRAADCQLFIQGKANYVQNAEESSEKDDSSLSGHINTQALFSSDETKGLKRYDSIQCKINIQEGFLNMNQKLHRKSRNETHG